MEVFSQHFRFNQGLTHPTMLCSHVRRTTEIDKDFLTGGGDFVSLKNMVLMSSNFSMTAKLRTANRNGRWSWPSQFGCNGVETLSLRTDLPMVKRLHGVEKFASES